MTRFEPVPFSASSDETPPNTWVSPKLQFPLTGQAHVSKAGAPPTPGEVVTSGRSTLTIAITPPSIECFFFPAWLQIWFDSPFLDDYLHLRRRTSHRSPKLYLTTSMFPSHVPSNPETFPATRDYKTMLSRISSSFRRDLLETRTFHPLWDLVALHLPDFFLYRLPEGHSLEDASPIPSPRLG